MPPTFSTHSAAERSAAKSMGSLAGADGVVATDLGSAGPVTFNA